MSWFDDKELLSGTGTISWNSLKKNLKFKNLIIDITFNNWFFKNFAIIEDITRKCYSVVNLLKFIFNEKILTEVVVTSYNQVYNQTLFKFYYFQNINNSSG